VRFHNQYLYANTCVSLSMLRGRSVKLRRDRNKHAECFQLCAWRLARS
jgi:hypothetical protein